MHGVLLPSVDRADWLTQRKSGIGASDVAGILGLSPWATPFTVWADKRMDVEDSQTEAMWWGRRLEDLILDEFTLRTGLHVGYRQQLVAHPDHPWVLATPDGIAYEGIPDEPEFDVDADPLGVVDAKSDAGFGRWNDGIPDHIVCQITWQMFATGLENAWVPVLHGGNRFEVYEVPYDKSLADTIFERVSEWRDRYLLGGETPEPDGSEATGKYITGLWPRSEGEAVELSASDLADVGALRGWKEEGKRVDAEIRRLENRLKVKLENAEAGTVDGQPVITWKTQHRDTYTVEASEFRVLRLKKGRT
jgi:putative phage-type endonuclease